MLINMLINALLLTIASTTSAQPDVVLVVVDDLGWADPGCMPDGRHDTPNIDALAARGALFTHATANAPNCAPARASLMTGQWTPRHGIFTVGSARRGKPQHRLLEPPPNRTSLRPKARTIAETLQDVGYRTVHVGKWHLGDDPTHQGFDLNIGGSRTGHPKSYFSPYFNTALTDGPEGQHLTDRLTDEAIAQLHADDTRPLFLYLPFYAVHAPLQADTAEVQAVQEAHPQWTRKQAVYDCMVRRTDANIGRLLEHVGPDTLVMLCSDHGGVGRVAHMGELRGCKGQLYEGGIRTPLLIAGSGIAPGSVIDTPVSLHELAPTIAKAAGAEDDKAAYDGQSLWLLLHGEPVTDRPPQFWHFPAYLEAGGAVDGRWRTTPVSVIRVGNWKLLEFHETGATEFYDLGVDPGETTDLSADKPIAHDALLGLLRAWRYDTDAPMSKPGPRPT